MKRYKKVLLLLVLLVGTSLQGSALVQAQLVTIKTPRNQSVEAIVFGEFSQYQLDQIEADAAKWLQDHYSAAQRTAPASGTYNCHSYAWHYGDGGSRVWINASLDPNTTTPPTNLQQYWAGTNPTYVRTSDYEGSRHMGSKVYYPNGDHSAVVVSELLVESKWGAWPRYRHKPSDSPYNSSALQYYIVPLTGNNKICTSGQYATTSISGATYNWSGVSVQMSPTGNTATATSTGHNGAAQVKVSIVSPYSGTTINGSKRIWVGKPATSTFILTGERKNYEAGGPGASFSVCPSETIFLRPNVEDIQEVTAYQWQINGSYEYIGGLTSSSLMVRTSGIVGADFSGTVRLWNGCNWSDPIPFYARNMNCDAGEDPFFVEPIVTESHVTMTASGSMEEAKEGAVYEAKLYNSTQQLVRTSRGILSEQRIYIKDLPKGLYYLHLTSDGKTIRKQVFVQ